MPTEEYMLKRQTRGLAQQPAVVELITLRELLKAAIAPQPQPMLPLQQQRQMLPANVDGLGVDQPAAAAVVERGSPAANPVSAPRNP